MGKTSKENGENKKKRLSKLTYLIIKNVKLLSQCTTVSLT